MVDHNKVHSWIGLGRRGVGPVNSYYGELILDPDRIVAFELDIENARNDFSAGRIQPGEYLRFVESVNEIKRNNVRIIESWAERVGDHYILYLDDRLGKFEYHSDKALGVSESSSDADRILYESVSTPLRQFPKFQDMTIHSKGHIDMR